MTQKFVMLCGIPASGKSTYKLSKDTSEYVMLSSDEIRQEIYNDANFQGDSNQVFSIMHERMLESLKEGRSVIYDATNISRKRRKHVLQLIRKIKCEKEIIYFNIDNKTAVKQDLSRDRVVGEQVINKMYKTLQIPQYYEGWDSIQVMKLSTNKINITKNIHELDFKSYKQMLSELQIAELVLDRPQNNPFHTLSIDRHIYKVYKYVKENYTGSFKEELLWSAIFHDTGKDTCRETKENLYDSFIGHENVSAQIAMDRLIRLGIHDMEFVFRVVDIIQNHMIYLNEEKLIKDKKDINNDMFRIKMLEFFRSADVSGK